MIQLSEVFSMIGVDGCSDVASSLAMQGSIPEVSIPIYEIFYLKFLSGEHTQFLASCLPEVNVLRQIAVSCGGVCCTINILDMDILTLLGALCVYTPNNGMCVFIKNNLPDLMNLTQDIAEMIASVVGVPLPPGSAITMDKLAEMIEFLVDKLIDKLQEDMSKFGINLLHWEELPNFYNSLRESGEMEEMHRYRAATGGATM